MRFFSRLKTGLALARRSIRVLRANPELMVFPVLGGAAGLVYLILLYVSTFGAGVGDDITTYVVLFIAYFGSTFIGTYFTAGLMYCTRQAFRGEDPTIAAGLRAASRNVAAIAVWAFVAAVVGVIIRVIEDSNDLAAQVVAALFSLGWAVMTYFVVPVIVFEDVGITAMIRRSGETVRETWGESLGAEAGVGLVTVVLVLLAAGVGILLIAVLGSVLPVFSLVGVVVLGGLVVVAGVIGETLTGIAKTALYVYATEDRAPQYFEDMDFGGGNDSTTSPGGGLLSQRRRDGI
ncbi:MAG: DUF6159 family protein [Halobacteriaceae archaeon]